MVTEKADENSFTNQKPVNTKEKDAGDRISYLRGKNFGQKEKRMRRKISSNIK